MTAANRAEYVRDMLIWVSTQPGLSIKHHNTGHRKTGPPRYSQVTADQRGGVWRGGYRIGALTPTIGDPGTPLASAGGPSVWEATRYDDQSVGFFGTDGAALRWLARCRPRPGDAVLTGPQAFVMARWNAADAQVADTEHAVGNDHDFPDLPAMRVHLASIRADAVRVGIPAATLDCPGRVVELRFGHALPCDE